MMLYSIHLLLDIYQLLQLVKILDFDNSLVILELRVQDTARSRTKQGLVISLGSMAEWSFLEWRDLESWGTSFGCLARITVSTPIETLSGFVVPSC